MRLRRPTVEKHTHQRHVHVLASSRAAVCVSAQLMCAVAQRVVANGVKWRHARRGTPIVFVEPVRRDGQTEDAHLLILRMHDPRRPFLLTFGACYT